MTRFSSLRLVGALGLAMAVAPAGALAQTSGSTGDPDFRALQERGRIGMGVDQAASTHVFDALPDGGRIEYRADGDDAEAIEQIRRHLREIQAAFEAGDFSTPAFVHARDVPGTAVMAERKEFIQYRYMELPRGGELRLITEDPQALAAIREFMAFQRSDHRAGGMDHGGMGPGGMGAGGMGPGAMGPGGMHGGGMHGGGMGQGAVNHGGMDHEGMGPGGMGRGGMGPGGMGAGGMGAGGMVGEGMHARHLEMGGGDEAFAVDMDRIHGLLMNHGVITRTVEHLPNGIRTLTESSEPEVAALIIAHVASMETRLESGEVFNLFSHTLPAIFEDYAEIRSEFEYTDRGVAVVQTSDDPALVEALQGHAAEVTEMVDEGMAAMMRGMMRRRMEEAGR